MINAVVRVAVLNNFNCTKKEFDQLRTFTEKYPDRSFFVNCNINTPKLRALNDHPYKAVITLNPDFQETALWNLVKLIPVDLKKIAFVRVKYVPDIPYIEPLIERLASCNIPVVITPQRFNSRKTVTPFGIHHYEFSHSRYRLTEDAKEFVEKLAKSQNNVYICDQKGLGCKGCGLCAKLTVGKTVPIYSLNLSTSGICPYNCLDCYSKTMQRFTTACGYRPIRYDVVKKNNKQKGTTRHIRHIRDTLTKTKGRR